MRNLSRGNAASANSSGAAELDRTSSVERSPRVSSRSPGRNSSAEPAASAGAVTKMRAKRRTLKEAESAPLTGAVRAQAECQNRRGLELYGRPAAEQSRYVASLEIGGMAD